MPPTPNTNISSGGESSNGNSSSSDNNASTNAGISHTNLITTSTNSTTEAELAQPSPPNSTTPSTASLSFEIDTVPNSVPEQNCELDDMESLSLVDRSLNLLDSGKYSDLTLIVQEKEIKAHKMFLMLSPYFEKQLAKDPNLTELRVDEIEYDEFQLFLKYLYTRLTPTKVEDAWPVLHCATKFHVPCLAEAASKLLESTLLMPFEETQQNSGLSVLSILEGSLTYKRSDLQESALKYICKNAFKILECDEFAKLSYAALELIIARDDLRAFDEMQVFDAVLRWAIPEYSEGYEGPISDEQKPVLGSCFEFVRFKEMRKFEFIQRCLPLNVLELQNVVSILQSLDSPIEKRSEIKHRDYYTPIGPVNNVKTVKTETRSADPWDNNSQIRFRVDKPGWVTHVLLPRPYNNTNYNTIQSNFTVKCKVTQKDIDKSTSEVISEVQQTIGLSRSNTECPIIQFKKPVRIYPGKYYWIAIRINASAGASMPGFYKCQMLEGKLPIITMTGQNGQGVTFEIGTEFTNNRITEVGFIIQPELSLQKISTLHLVRSRTDISQESTPIGSTPLVSGAYTYTSPIGSTPLASRGAACTNSRIGSTTSASRRAYTYIPNLDPYYYDDHQLDSDAYYYDDDHIHMPNFDTYYDDDDGDQLVSY